MKTNYWIFLLLSGVLPGIVFSQGMLSGSAPPTDIIASSRTLTIGDPVSGTLMVMDAERQPRTLLSHKSSLQILVVAFVSQTCPADEKIWRRLRKLEEEYREWRVSFVAVDPVRGDSLTQLKEDFKRRHLHWNLARETDLSLAKLFGIQKLPTIVIIDESGYLRFRGPTEKAEEALKTIIAHIDPLLEPDPAVKDGCPVE